MPITFFTSSWCGTSSVRTGQMFNKIDFLFNLKWIVYYPLYNGKLNISALCKPINFLRHSLNGPLLFFFVFPQFLYEQNTLFSCTFFLPSVSLPSAFSSCKIFLCICIQTQRFNVHENPFHYTHYRPLYLDTFSTQYFQLLQSQNVAIEKPISR